MKSEFYGCIFLEAAEEETLTVRFDPSDQNWPFDINLGSAIVKLDERQARALRKALKAALVKKAAL